MKIVKWLETKFLCLPSATCDIVIKDWITNNYITSLPVQICFGNASLFSKNWYKPVGLTGVVVVGADSARAILEVLKVRLVTFKERVILCKMDIFWQLNEKRMKFKIGRDLIIEFCEGGTAVKKVKKKNPVWLDLLWTDFWKLHSSNIVQ